MNAFVEMVDALFEDENLAQDAGYAPPEGAAIPSLRVILKRGDVMTDFAGRVTGVQEGRIVEVRVSELANPVKDGVFTLGSGEELKIKCKPQRLDTDALIWTCECV